MRYVLQILTGCALLAASAARSGPLDDPRTAAADDPAASQQAPATLVVAVSYVFRPGEPRPSRVLPTRAPGAGLAVCVVPAGGGAPVANGTTDSNGQVTLQVPAGAYWVFVPPLGPDAPPPARNVGVTTLPDGTPALQWWDGVEVAAGVNQTVDVTLDVASS